jgi:hypothetical protein
MVLRKNKGPDQELKMAGILNKLDGCRTPAEVDVDHDPYPDIVLNIMDFSMPLMSLQKHRYSKTQGWTESCKT